MRDKTEISDGALPDEGIAPAPSRKVSLPLFIGVLLLPVLFVWFLMRRGYSTRSQIIGVSWLGVIGLVLLLSVPHAAAPIVSPNASPAPSAVKDGQPRPWEAQSTLSAPSGQAAALDVKLGQTRSVYRMLRTTASLTNNVGRDLQYVEVFCSYYDGAGALLGYGMSNWAKVNAGDTVTGEVVASGVSIDDVTRRECRVRHL